MAGDYGRDDVGADEAQSGARRSDAAGHLQLDAADLHLHAGEVSGWAGNLLGLEQYALGDPAERHHAPQRRQDRTLEQSQKHFRQAEAQTTGGIVLAAERPGPRSV